jgi:phage terminase small subunit
MPNPPKPLEVKKREGTYRKDRDKSLQTNNVIPFNPVDGIPECPADFQLAGQQLWNQIWGAGASWINSVSDLGVVEAACRMADIATVARNRALVTTDPGDVRAAIQANSESVKMLSLLGFTPADRTRMGVQQVQAQSSLQRLMEKKKQQRG